MYSLFNIHERVCVRARASAVARARFIQWQRSIWVHSTDEYKGNGRESVDISHQKNPPSWIAPTFMRIIRCGVIHLASERVSLRTKAAINFLINWIIATRELKKKKQKNRAHCLHSSTAVQSLAERNNIFWPFCAHSFVLTYFKAFALQREKWFKMSVIISF